MSDKKAGAEPRGRQPVIRRGNRVTGLWQRRTKDGQVRFDAQIRRAGKPTFVVLQATDVDAAIVEAAQVRHSVPERPSSMQPGGVTVEELTEAMIADMSARRFRMRTGRPYKASTVGLYRITLEHRIVPLLGAGTAWRSLRRVDIDRVVDELGMRPANTARNTITVLRTLDRFAARRLGSERLTLELEGVPESERTSEPVLVDASVIANVPERHRVAAALCLYAGLRASEACGIEWRHVDLDSATLTVEQQLDHEGEAFTSPKSRNSLREVPIVPALRAELEAHAERSRRGQDDLAQRRPLEGRLYAYERHVLRRALKRSLAVSPQDLRHSFKEALREAEVGEVDSARLAGHSPKVGSTHYASGDAVERSRAKVTRAFS